MAACASCKAPIIWAVTERNGKPMPVDSDPLEGGNILLSHCGLGEPPVALVQGPLEIEGLRVQHDRSPDLGPLRLFISHFATCPNADQHRKA